MKTTVSNWVTIEDEISLSKKYKIPENADINDWNFTLEGGILKVNITYVVED